MESTETKYTTKENSPKEFARLEKAVTQIEKIEAQIQALELKKEEIRDREKSKGYWSYRCLQGVEICELAHKLNYIGRR